MSGGTAHSVKRPRITASPRAHTFCVSSTMNGQEMPSSVYDGNRCPLPISRTGEQSTMPTRICRDHRCSCETISRSTLIGEALLQAKASPSRIGRQDGRARSILRSARIVSESSPTMAYAYTSTIHLSSTNGTTAAAHPVTVLTCHLRVCTRSPSSIMSMQGLRALNFPLMQLRRQR